MAQGQLKKVFFDLDGTLLDVSERNYRVYQIVTREFGGTPLDKDTYWELKRRKTKWPGLLPKSKLDPSVEQEFLARFIPLIESPEFLRLDRIHPAALATVAAISHRRSSYLVSLRRNETALLQELDWLGLGSSFTKVLSGHSESDGYDKKIELIASEIGADEGVIIGDTEADIVSGKELGLVTVAVTSGIRDEQFLAVLKPDYVVKHIGEVLNLPIFTN
jgi:phosphoglycolate phosphatase